MAKYQKLWTDPTKYLRVSQQEFHPSAQAHEMFADILFDEVTKMWN